MEGGRFFIACGNEISWIQNLEGDKQRRHLVDNVSPKEDNRNLYIVGESIDGNCVLTKCRKSWAFSMLMFLNDLDIKTRINTERKIIEK